MGTADVRIRSLHPITASLLMLLTACGNVEAPPVAPSRTADAVPTGDLPRLGVLNDPPTGALVIAIRADGTVVTDDSAADLDAVERSVERHTKDARVRRVAENTSGLDVLLRIHGDAPFSIVFALIDRLTGPLVNLHGIHVAARPETGDGEGSFDLRIERQRGIHRPILVPADEHLALIAYERAPAPPTLPDGARDRALYAALRDALPRLDTQEVRIAGGSMGNARSADVLRIIDLARRAGARGVRLDREALGVRTASGASNPTIHLRVRAGEISLANVEGTLPPAPPRAPSNPFRSSEGGFPLLLD